MSKVIRSHFYLFASAIASGLFFGSHWAYATIETISSTQSWVAPDGVTEVLAECWGGGGNGATGPNKTGTGTGGGGGGAYAKRDNITIVPGNTYTATVGQGGSPGGTTSFTNGSLGCSAVGGGAGASTVGGTGGAAGSSVGDLKYSGGNGYRYSGVTAAGGGGGSAGTASDGLTATSSDGAPAVLGGGAGGSHPIYPSIIGNPGLVPGGGGSSGDYSRGAGGAGAAGQLKLTYISLVIDQPDGTNDTIEPNASYTINYTLTDTSGTASTTLYYDTDNTGLNGTVISNCQNLPEASGGTCVWNTTGVSQGDYYIYGLASNTIVQTSDYSSGPITIAAPPDTTTGLIDHWTFDSSSILDGKPQDAGSNNIPLTLVNISTSTFYTSSGKMNDAVVFDGTNDYATTDGPPLQLGENVEFTVSLWVYRNATKANAAYWSMGDKGTTNRVITSLYEQNNGVFFRWCKENVLCTDAPAITVALSQWHMLTSTFKNKVLSFYVDGQYSTGTTSTLTGLSSGTGANMLIAEYWGGYYTSSRIDDFRIYNRALSAADISQLFDESQAVAPGAPTNVAASDGTFSEKVVVNWTKSTGATNYRVYRDNTDVSGLLGDVATYDDTGAGAPSINAGTADATDGTYASKIVLSLTGTSTTAGTTHSYKVLAINSAGTSSDSMTDNGYRGGGTLTYQWQRSSGDGDSGYSNIGGATTATYNDTGAPLDGTGRYYKCVVSAGSAQATSTIDRGYVTPVSITLDQTTFNYGRVASNSSTSTLSLWEGLGIRATNGAVAAAFDIYSGNTTGSGTGWVLATDNTGNHYMHEFCNDSDNVCTLPGGYPSYSKLTTTPQTLKASVVGNGTVAFQLLLTTPQAPTDMSQQSAVITVQASAP